MPQSGHHPENNLAKFGYILDMKVRNLKKNFYILSYLLELLIKKIRFELFFLQNKGLIISQKRAIIGGNFFYEKSFCINVLYCCSIEVYGIWTVDGISPTIFISVLHCYNYAVQFASSQRWVGVQAIVKWPAHCAWNEMADFIEIVWKLVWTQRGINQCWPVLGF